MKPITDFLARLGENPVFVAFMAHCWFAAFFTYLALEHHAPMLPVLAIVMGLAAGKEFYFDANYETTPPQTFMDDLGDFLGYCAGALIAMVAAVFS